MILAARALLSVMTIIWLAGCSGGSDSSPQTTSPGSNPPPGNTPPQPTAQAGRFNGPVTAMTPVPNGNGDIYVAGHFTTYNNQPVRPVVRLRPDGTLNDSFKLTDTISAVSSTNLIPGIAAADDGSGDLYVAEVFVAIDDSPDDKAQVWKVTSAGGIASGFTPGTLRYLGTIPSPTHTDVLAIVPVGDGSGRVYVGGLFGQYNQTTVPHLVRLNPNGTIDPTFNPTISTTAAPGVRNLLPAKDGSGDLYVMSYGLADDGGATPTLDSLSVYRRNADGTEDPSFATFTVPTSLDRVRSFALVEDGSGDIFVSGTFVRCCGIGVVNGFVRLNPDGTLDQTSPRPQTGFPSLMAKATDGTNEWFVRGNIVNTEGIAGSQLDRYKADGTLDPNFTAGQVNTVGTSQCTVINHGGLCDGIGLIIPAPDATGDVYVAGGFTTYNSVAVGHIVRINRDGTLE